MSNLQTNEGVKHISSELMPTSYKFRKTERLCSKKQIELLFEGGASRSLTAFPLRAVFRFIDKSEQGQDSKPALHSCGEVSVADHCAKPDLQEGAIKLLISVPKKCFKRAVKRNRVKRQLREAYRKHRQLLAAALEKHAGCTLLLAFIWTTDELVPTTKVDVQVENLLKRIKETTQ